MHARRFEDYDGLDSCVRIEDSENRQHQRGRVPRRRRPELNLKKLAQGAENPDGVMICALSGRAIDSLDRDRTLPALGSWSDTPRRRL